MADKLSKDAPIAPAATTAAQAAPLLTESVETEIQISTEILIMLLLLMLSITLGHFLKKSKHKYLQEAGLTTLLGMLAGLVLRLINVAIYMKKIQKHFVNLFMLLLLPPIIFESGYNLNKGPMFRNFGTVMMYSFVGTFIAIFSTSTMFYFTAKYTPESWQPEFTLQESFAFGSLISATDPVAVLAIFKELNADVNLYSIVFGESIFNDAIGIVMYETVKDLGSGSFAGEIVGALSKFTIIFGGSLLIGMASALLVAFIQKRQLNFLRQAEIEEPNDASFPRTKAEGDLNKRQKHFEEQQTFNSEISMMILCPWVSYLVADGLQLSGIVAILTNGLFLNMYATPNISKGSGKVLQIAYETIAYSAETLVFVFLGIGVFAFDHPLERLGFGAIVLTIVNVNIARALNVLIVTALVNRTRSDATKITSDQKFVMWVAGLRGAMAYALSMQSIADYGPAGNIMLSLTLIYSLITILIVGSLLNPILERWADGVKGGVKDENPVAIAEAQPDEGPEQRKKCCADFKRGLKNFDQKYFAPLFIRTQSDKRSPGKGTQNSPRGTENIKLERQGSDWSLHDTDTRSSQPEFQ